MSGPREPMADRLRTAVFWGGLGFYCVVLAWIAVTAPAVVPAQVGVDGRVTREASKPVFLLTMAGLAALLVLVTRGARALMRRIDARWISLPSPEARRYWTAPENRAEFARKMGSDLDLVFGGALVLLGASTWSMNASGPSTFVPGLIFAATAIAYVIWLGLGPRYRVPRDEP